MDAGTQRWNILTLAAQDFQAMGIQLASRHMPFEARLNYTISGAAGLSWTSGLPERGRGWWVAPWYTLWQIWPQDLPVPGLVAQTILFHVEGWFHSASLFFLGVATIPIQIAKMIKMRTPLNPQLCNSSIQKSLVNQLLTLLCRGFIFSQLLLLAI